MFCPVCRSEYADDWKVCPKDAASLLRSTHVGKYRIDQLLGAGGMGAVYRAYNPDTQSTVAVKLMHGGADAGDAARQRFQREAAAVAALRTRHVVTIFDFGSDVDGTLYLVMEYMQGHPLRAEIRPLPDAVPLPRVNFLVDQALRGLGAAHRAEIVHRDLKPENLYVATTDDGEVVKILDFGIARVQRGDTPNLTHSGALMGTPAYMAPEQVAGNRGQVGPHSDVYAMGVIVYELLTGGSPFYAETLSEVLSRILSRQFTPLAQVRPDLPPAVATLVDRALADDPEARFPNADAMREAWAAAWGQLPADVRAASVPGWDGAPSSPAHANDVTSQPLRTPSTGNRNREAFAGTVAAGSGAASGAGVAATAHQSMTPGPVVVSTAGSTGEPPRKSKAALWAVLGVLAVGGGAAAAVVLGGGGGAESGTGAGTESGSGTGAGTAGAGTGTGTGAGTGTGTGTGAAIAPDAAPDAEPPREGMVRFDAGTFTMGVDPAAYRAIPSIDPAHEATVGAFWIDQREAAGADGQPLTKVTWADADAHCRERGKRLPTAAEWERAARSAPLDAAGAALKSTKRKGPAPVGSHPGDCTPDGLCDLLGNVMEWTADDWPDDPANKVVRGASFAVGADAGWYASVHARVPVPPDTADREIGFRCAADAAPSGEGHR